MSLEKEIESGQGGRLHRRMERFRAFMGRHAALLLLYRLLIIWLGFLCIVAGLIMLVTPGPGWLPGIGCRPCGRWLPKQGWP